MLVRGPRAPDRTTPSVDLRLTMAEREEISRGLAAGLSLRAIAVGLGRAPSTVCREVNAGGGRSRYRALHAERDARRRARRPKVVKLARCHRLRQTSSGLSRACTFAWSTAEPTATRRGALPQSRWRPLGIVPPRPPGAGCSMSPP